MTFFLNEAVTHCHHTFTPNMKKHIIVSTLDVGQTGFILLNNKSCVKSVDFLH